MGARVKPIKPGDYAPEMSGNWGTVPNWAIRRINFLEECLAVTNKQRCPMGEEPCPAAQLEGPISCSAVKHCYSHICDGRCGHNEIYVTDEEKLSLIQARKEKYGDR